MHANMQENCFEKTVSCFILSWQLVTSSGGDLDKYAIQLLKFDG